MVGLGISTESTVFPFTPPIRSPPGQHQEAILTMLLALSGWVWMWNLENQDIPKFSTHWGMLKPSKIDQIQRFSSQVCVLCWSFIEDIRRSLASYCPQHGSRFILTSCHLACIRHPPSTLEAGRAASCRCSDIDRAMDWNWKPKNWLEVHFFNSPTICTSWSSLSTTHLSSTLVLYKRFSTHPFSILSKLGTFKLRGNTSPAKLCRTLKRTPEGFPKKQHALTEFI